jgi:LPS-assembly protein
MKKLLIFIISILSHFPVYAEGIELTCSPNISDCDNCPEYEYIFPVENLSNDTKGLEVEADNSEIINGKYVLSGNVQVNSANLFLSGNNVKVSSDDDSIIANGNVKFQDNLFLISSDSITAKKNNDGIVANATNANYQDYSIGHGGANGFTESLEKTPSSILLKNSTYSICPIDGNDWLIKADQIKLDLDKNRGVANNATLKFFGVPIFYTPKYSWVLSGRGSGFLTPEYSTYDDSPNNDDAYSLRVPYYFDLAPDRDLLVALTYMSSRRFVYEGKYRQLIAPKISSDSKDSIYSIEAKYLPVDKVTGLSRWLVNFSEEWDISEKVHLSANFYRVSDSKYFEEIERANTDTKTLKSSLKYLFEDEDNDLSFSVLTEDEQVVNDGTPDYTRALEGSLTKTINADEKMPLQIDIVSTRFAHDTPGKESGTRTHGKVGVSRELNIEYPIVTPRASINLTNYSLQNNPNINRIIFGSGLDVDFTVINKTRLFGFEVNHEIIPLISYNYRAKKMQGNIPLFDSTDKYDDIISFSDLTSGERYSGLDRITNANDITVSLESSYKHIDALENDKDLLSMKIAQTYFTDDEVVSDSVNTNFETRKSYSDIAASIDMAVNKFVLSSSGQYSPSKSKIVKKTNTVSYSPSSRQFVALTFINDGDEETEKFYGAYPLTDKIHVFGGLDKTTSTGITNSETTGIAYESCCWAFRLAHFKENGSSGGYNYSTGVELVFSGLGSTTSNLQNKIEKRISGYSANLR